MATLMQTLEKKIPEWQGEIRDLLKEHGDKKLSDVTVTQAFGGMRGVKGLFCNTSLVSPDAGLIIRGRPIFDLKDRLPEEIFFLLLTGELPDEEGLKDLQQELNKRAEVPEYVWKVLEALPDDFHPMAMLDTAILSMQKYSIFKKKYDEGMSKMDYWRPTLEDALSLLAKMPSIAAGVYRIRYNKGPRIDFDPNLSWAANYARMLGVNDKDEFMDLMRLYLVLHSDHEGGNVSAFTCHIVNSALSDLYYSVSAGFNGLAGPLHGLANQECLGFVLSIYDKYGRVPSDEELTQFCWDTLNSGRVIPGYGHAVLRVTDPRFSAFIDFGKKYCSDSSAFQIVEKMFNIVPEVLKEHGKAKNPWPNVDAGSGSLLYYFGIKEFPYYTVPFAVSRALGLCSQAVMSRAMGEPITRPKSLTTQGVKKAIGVA